MLPMSSESQITFGSSLSAARREHGGQAKGLSPRKTRSRSHRSSDSAALSVPGTKLCRRERGTVDEGQWVPAKDEALPPHPTSAYERTLVHFMEQRVNVIEQDGSGRLA